RLTHVLNYLVAAGLEGTRVDEVDDTWVVAFRKWMTGVPIVSPQGSERKRSPGTVEASVLQLRAAINFAFKKRKLPARADFEVKSAKVVSRTPWFRMTDEQLVQSFRYALVQEFPYGATVKLIAKWM